MKVLISRDYGAGFSTWNDLEMAIDQDLIKLFEDGCTQSELKEACRKKGYGDFEDGPYMGGFEGLAVVEVPKGAVFKINESDGYEYIEIFNPDRWFYAEE